MPARDGALCWLLLRVVFPLKRAWEASEVEIPEKTMGKITKFLSPVRSPYRSSKWHYRQREIICGLIMHFIADTDTDENCFGINLSLQMQTASCSLQFRGGHA